MVNLKATVRVKTKKGLYPVYIRFTKGNQVSYVKTSWVVNDKGLDKKKNITDADLEAIRYLGLVREYQHKNYDSHYEGVKLSDWPDYGKIAEAYGLTYNECASNDELDEKLDWFLEGEGARILVCDVDSENNVK